MLSPIRIEAQAFTSSRARRRDRRRCSVEIWPCAQVVCSKQTFRSSSKANNPRLYEHGAVALVRALLQPLLLKG
jgi:hypothetical protein